MAAGSLPAPGTRYGPCAGDCRHADCDATRAQAQAECVYCKEVIGFERRFYAVSPYDDSRPPRFAHATCHEQAIEEGCVYV